MSTTNKPTPEEIARWRALPRRVIKAVATLLHATALEGVSEQQGDAWREIAVAARDEYDALREAVPRLCDRVAALEAENAKLRARELVGQRMSNLCFNLSQDAVTFEPRHRQEMRDLYQQWDGPIARGKLEGGR
jgi:hypothetical protein